MDALRFDRLARVLVDTATRRTTLGLGGAGLLGALGPADANAKKKGKKNKKTCKKCGPCKQCKKGKCKPKRAGTPCGEGQQCFADGACHACDVCLGDCDYTSLQEAINAASPGVSIQFCPGTYPTRDVLISENLGEVTLVGAGSGVGGTVLDGANVSRILTVNRSAIVKLRALTVSGGAAEFGAGINNARGNLTLEDVHVTKNRATGGGGGMFSSGVMVIINSRITENSASVGGGIHNGSNIFDGDLTLARSTVTGNTGSTSGGNDGHTAGGIHNERGRVLVIDGSRVTGNVPFDCAGTEAC